MSKKFELAQSDKKMNVEIREGEDGKLRAFLKELGGDADQPVRMGFVDKIGQGDGAFLVIKAPLRVQADDGSFPTRARQRDGKFLDAQGKEVDSEEKAAREYVLKTQTNDPAKLVYGQIAVLNIKNQKLDKTPTAMTLVRASFWSDEKALEAERINYKMQSVGKEHQDYPGLMEDLKALRKASVTYSDFFINSGHDSLRQMGFEVRERVAKASSDVQPS